MPPNSVVDPKEQFFHLFTDLWNSGKGRTKKADPRYARWTSKEFLNAMDKVGAATTDDSLRNWKNGKNLPAPAQIEGILKVFFPAASPGMGVTDDDAAWQSMEALWQTAWYGRHAGQPLPPLEPSEPIKGWINLGGSEFDGLVEFRLHPPDAANDADDRHYVRATLWIGTVERDWEGGTVEISLVNALVVMPSTSYQPAEKKMIGEADNTHDHFERSVGGARIIGPRPDDRHLSGDVLLGAHLAVIEPAQRGGGPLTVRIVADRNCFDVIPRVDDNSEPPVHVNKQHALKALIFDACGKDSLNRAILAERLMKRVETK